MDAVAICLLLAAGLMMSLVPLAVEADPELQEYLHLNNTTVRVGDKRVTQ